MLKICCICKLEKETSEFARDKTQRDGRYPSCKICSRARAKTLYTQKYGEKAKQRMKLARNENRRRFDELKAAFGCSFCAERDPIAIDFHHHDPKQKDFQFGDHMQRPWWRLSQELIKCIPVCSNCHRKVHAGKLITHDSMLLTESQIQEFGGCPKSRFV